MGTDHGENYYTTRLVESFGEYDREHNYVACKRPATVDELAKRMIDASEMEGSIEYRPLHEGDVHRSVADILAA